MKPLPSPPSVAVAVDLAADAASTDSLPRSRRLVLLVAALLLVALVNTAHLVGVQEYMQLPMSRGVSMAASTAETATVEPTVEVSNAPQQSSDCVHLDKGHIDPGYFRADTCLTRAELLAIIKELVFTAADAFDAHNVTYFLDSGTLLGAFRDQRVIPHDNDADVGIDAAGLDYLRHNAIAFPEPYAFTVWNSTLYPRSDRDDKLPARLIHKASGVYLDVFAFLDWTDEKTGAAVVGPLASGCFFNCVSCPRAASGGNTLRVDPDWIYPLVNCTFEGRDTFKCPHKTHEYLQYVYGKNYMTPVKYTHG